MTDSINEQHRFAPHDVAGMFNVSVMTVRRWAEYHKAHLSESANPSPGKPRSFTWADVETFRQIKAWRDEGLSVDAINNRLTGSVTEPITATVTDNTAIAHTTAQESPQQAQAFMVVVQDLQRQIDAIQQSRRDAVSWFALGFLVAGFLFLGMVLLSWLYAGN